MSDFQRQERYKVLRLSDLTEQVSKDLLVFLHLRDVSPVSAVVVEPDHLGYAVAWDLVEAHVRRKAQTVAELTLTRVALKEAQKHISAMQIAVQNELGAAMLREAGEHPWLGGKVRRKVRSYSISDNWRTQKGIVRQCGAIPIMHQKGHRPEPGEFYVVSHSGHTAYKLNQVGAIYTAWELDE